MRDMQFLLRLNLWPQRTMSPASSHFARNLCALRRRGEGRRFFFPAEARYLEACPLAPHDVPLVVGPLAEEVYDKGRMAVCGFGVRGQN